MNKKRYLFYINTIGLIIASVVYIGMRHMPHTFTHAATTNTSAAAGRCFYVASVVDGDTLKLSNGERVRLIGIDTPELHYSDKLLRDARKRKVTPKEIQRLGNKAYIFTKNLCEKKSVSLVYDIEKHDRYGRTLAYVYLDDGTFVNAKILEEGYAQLLTIPPNVKFADYFFNLQKKARTSGAGLWAEGLEGK